MKIKPFKGLHYPAGNISEFIAPPYDILDQNDKDELLARSPQNIVAVDLPHVPPKDLGPEEAYLNSARLLDKWKASGKIVQDDKPAIYGYEQSYTWAGKSYARRAIFVGVKSSPFGEDIIPHEHTFAGPKADRLKLTECTKTQLSPIFGFYNDPIGVTEKLWATADDEPNLEGELNGVTEKLWIITDENAINEITAGLASIPIYIADGHHRCTTAMNYADALKEAGKIDDNAEANYILFALIARDDPGLLVLPTHRLVNGLTSDFTAESLLSKLDANFECKLLGKSADIDLSDADAALADCAEHTIGLLVGEDIYAASLKNPQAMIDAAPDQCDAWRELDVAILHELIIEKALRYFTTSDTTVEYTPDGELAKRAVNAGACNVACILRGTPLKAVEDVADASGSMPHKSTYFYPKIATGMVLKPLE